MNDIEVFAKIIAMLFVGMFLGLAMKKPDRRRSVSAEYDGVERCEIE
jgi:hypothetical protein